MRRTCYGQVSSTATETTVARAYIPSGALMGPRGLESAKLTALLFGATELRVAEEQYNEAHEQVRAPPSPPVLLRSRLRRL